MKVKSNKTESTYKESAQRFSTSGKSISLLILILTVITVAVVGLTITILYQTSFEGERARLSDTAKSQARFIEAVARFDKKFSGGDIAGGSFETTMSQLREAHENFGGIGDTGEFTLAKKDGEQIIFLLNHRHHDLTNLRPVAWNAKNAEPMRLALQGKSGTIVALDYRGELVLAAYEPIAALNLGIVAKIDLSEIRSPFIRAGSFALTATIFLIILGAYLFQRIGNPLLRRIEESDEQTRLLLNSTAEGIYGLDLDGNCTFANEACLRLTGHNSISNLLGKNIHELIHHTRKDGSHYPLAECKIYKASLDDIGIQADDEIFWRSDGTNFAVQYSSFPIKKHGKIIGSVVTFSDITTRLHAEEVLAHQKALLTAIFESIPDAIVYTDINREIVSINAAFSSIFEFDIDDLAGKKTSCFYESIAEYEHQGRLRYNLTAAQQSLPYVVNYRKKDGTLFPGETLGAAIKDDSGNILGFVGVIRDIAERQLSEIKLYDAKEQYQSLVHSLPVGVYLFVSSPDGSMRFEFVSPMFCEVYGIVEEDFLRDPSLAFTSAHPDDYENLVTANKHAIEHGKTFSWAGRLIINGKTKWVEIKSEPSSLSNGDTLWSGLVNDISERKIAEQALKEASKLTSTIISELSAGITIYDESGQCSLANEEMAKQTGATSIDLLLSQNFNTIESWKKSGLYDSALKALNENAHQRLQVDFITSFGKQATLDCHFVPFSTSGQKKLLLTTYDISDLRHYEKLMSEYEDRLRMLSSSVEQTQEAISITDIEGTILYVNPAFAELTGYSEDEALNQNPRILKSGKQNHSFYQQMWQVLNSGEAWQGRVVNKKRDGSYYPSLLTISPIKNNANKIVNFVGIQQDLTELENLEEQLHQSQKMEALGTLVGGIAHEFNNSLAGVTGNIYFAKKEAKELPNVMKRLETIEKLSFASAELIKSLLSFAHKGIVQKTRIPLSIFLKENIKIERISLPENISMTSDIEMGTMVVEGDANLLQQILMNIVNNARDALSDVTSPLITIKSDMFIADSVFFDTHPGCSSEKYARISIRDNGSGIKADDLPHVFYPFYTTKEVGNGTGLGLSMAYGTLQTHGGAIEIESVAGIGTLVTVYLPLAESDIENALTVAETDIVYGNNETILLVDDNESILTVGSHILESINYNVLTATNGLEAIAVFNANKDLIKLVLTDVVMPVMGGVDAVKKLRETNPELKVIFSTGYDRDNMRQSDNMDEETIITKPFKVSVLSSTLRKILDHS